MIKNTIVALFVAEVAAISHHHHHKHHEQFRPIPGTAPWHEQYEVKRPVISANKKHYTVPAHGFENDLIPKANVEPWTYPTATLAQARARSDPICSSAGCDQYLHPAPPADPPMDYFVPNFGKDPEITGTADSIDLAENMFKHKIILGTPES